MNNDYIFDSYRLAEFYDYIYFYEDDYELWSHFLSPGKKVLEVACGTGRLTRLLLENNKDISLDVLDYSEEMLEILKTKLENWKFSKSNTINIIRADMRSYYSSQKYDVIIISSNSLNHIETNEDMQLTINNMYNHLNPGGVLLFDILNPKFEYLIRDLDNDYDEKIYWHSKKKCYFQLSEKSKYDSSTQINHVVYTYTYCNKDGKKKEDSPEYQMSIKVRLYFPQEIDYYLSNSKFKIYKKYGWYDMREFDGTTSEQIFVLQREY